MEEYFDNKKSIGVFMKWKKHIIIATLLAGIIGGIISYFIKPKYESIAIAYPSNVSPYSDETETEQALQIFQSVDIRNAVIEEKNLYEHYDIQKDAKLAAYYMNTKWSDNVSVSRTSNDAIKIRVLDNDPEMACAIVKSIINHYNLLINGIHKSKFEEVAALFDRQRHRKIASLDSLKREIRQFNEIGIYDVPFQSKELAAAMLGVGTSGSSGNAAKIAEMQKAFNEHSGDYLAITAWLNGESEAITEFIIQYDLAFSMLDRKYTHVSVISSPEVPQKRYSPVRWIYVTLFAFGGLLMSLITVGCIDSVQAKKSR